MSDEIRANDEQTYAATERTALRRRSERGTYERAAVHALLDEVYVAHVAVCEGEAPRVIPMAHARIGEQVYLHGSPSNRVLRALGEGAQGCLVVTALDGLVLAKSGFHHSMNYRCVVAYGPGRRVRDEAELRAALDAFVDKVEPGRAARVRPYTREELLGTLVVALELREVSMKQRSGGPIDDEGDLAWPIERGVIPLALTHGARVAAP